MIASMISIMVILALSAYLPADSGLKFNHAQHFTENSIACADCHSVAASQNSDDKNIPGHDKCSDCHSTEKAPQDCALCHVNADDPTGVSMKKRELIFSHQKHLKSPIESELCLSCHAAVDRAIGPLTADHYPKMDNCFACHDGAGVSAECSLCHSRPNEMASLVHAPGWKHEHRYAADAGGESCAPCHQTETFCSQCHAGDNIVGTVHELNYRDSHGLDARGNEYQCQSCHDPETFCSSCHAQAGAKPFDHSSSDWALPPYAHAEAAQQDVESCAACHSSDSPVCVNCHFDTDGVIGTNPPIHPVTIDDLGEGRWHDDPGFQCFTCHVNTRTAGEGFCGYCHGAQE